jgi:hypothetical protein
VRTPRARIENLEEVARAAAPREGDPLEDRLQAINAALSSPERVEEVLRIVEELVAAGQVIPADSPLGQALQALGVPLSKGGGNENSPAAAA